MSTWKQRLVDLRKDVFLDALQNLCGQHYSPQSLIPSIKTINEAEELLKWSGYTSSSDMRLIWHLVGTIHQNFLSPKTSLLAWATEHDASPKMRTRNGGTLLHECVDASLVHHLIRFGVDVGVLDQEKRTALQCVLMYGSFDVAWQLIQHNAPLYTKDNPPNRQEAKSFCASAATLLCFEYYHVEQPPFASPLWRYLKSRFEWDDLGNNQQLFFYDLSKWDAAPSSWLHEVIADLNPKSQTPSKEQEKFITPHTVSLPWHVSCETGLRYTLSSLNKLPLCTDQYGKNILDYACAYYCLPVFEHIRRAHPCFFAPNESDFLSSFDLPGAFRSNSYTCFCPDLLLQSFLDDGETLPTTLLSGWSPMAPSSTHKFDETVSLEAYNRLLSEALRGDIYKQIDSIYHRKTLVCETEQRRM